MLDTVARFTRRPWSTKAMTAFTSIPAGVADDDQALLSGSVLFEPEFYRAQVANLPPDMEPVVHYLVYGAVAGLDPGTGFSTRWYTQAYLDVRSGSTNPLVHYLRFGQAEGRLICPPVAHDQVELLASSQFFDAAYYQSQVPGLTETADAATHYLARGRAAGLKPSRLFDPAWYRQAHADVAASGADPLLHYVTSGLAEGRASCPVLDTDDVQLIATSALYDAKWYRSQVEGLSESADAAAHYLAHGATGTPNPSPAFDAAWYLHAYPDVRVSGSNPLLQYLRSGIAEGRLYCTQVDPVALQQIASSSLFNAAYYRMQVSALPPTADAAAHYLAFGDKNGANPGPSFDTGWYRASYPDVAQNAASALLHYLNSPPAAGRMACAVVSPAVADRVYRSGLFEEAWYRAQAQDLPIGAAALPHYVTFGGQSGLSPGPLFDSRWYLRTYPDIAVSGANPLIHFLECGQTEGRQSRTVGPTSDQAGHRTIAASIPPNPIPAGRVAVMVHAYYPDMIGEVCNLLCNIPGRFALMVAVPSAPGQQIVEAAVAAAGLNVSLTCRIFPNRGRNFGSMLVGFGADLKSFDLLLHLHTKRSLYSGQEQTQWRESLFEGLIGSSSLVKLIFGMFEAEPKLGLFYPATAVHMPYWAHHWLSNAHNGEALLARLGIREFQRHGYLDYPVGGMFWCRVDAIRPLFDADLRVEDFAEEAGQTDGTLAHAIERVIGQLAKARDYDFVEFDHDKGLLRLDWSDKNLHQYRYTSLEAFEALLCGVHLVSFDIFDTILTRPTLSADSVLRYVGYRINKNDPLADDFFERRKGAEARARERRDGRGDVDLAAIYASFEPDDVWTVERIREAAALERSTDGATLRPRPGAAEMLYRVRRSGLRVIAISDSYYTEAEIKDFLRCAGIAQLIDKYYISSAEGARKDRGDLWDRVILQEGVLPVNWLHVGDNEQSDIQAACDRGIRFFHVMHPATLLQLDGFRCGTEPDERRWTSDLVVGPAMPRLAGCPFRNGRNFGRTELRDAQEVGAVVFGPIMFMFIAWIVRHPALDCVSHLYFLSREGHFLHQLYDQVRSRWPHLGLPPATYFYTSRRSTLSALQASWFAPDHIINGAGYRGSVQDLLTSRIGLEMPSDYRLADWMVELPRDDAAVLAALKVLQTTIEAHGAIEADRLIAYANQEGLLTSGPPGKLKGVVDIGYAATIQKNLQHITGQSLIGFYMGAYATAHEVEEKGGFAFGCLAESISAWSSDCPALKNSLLMEAFLTAPHGQVLSFHDADGSIMPSFKESGLDANRLDLLNKLHTGASDYCLDLINTYGSDLLYTDIELMVPQEFVRMLVAGDLVLPPELQNIFRVEDDFCGNGEITFSVGL